MLDEYKVRYKVLGDDKWLTGTGGDDKQARAAANKYWAAGATEVQISRVTETVVGHKKRSLTGANIDL